MSGFEMAAIVLAVIPILVSAAKEYERTEKAILMFWRTKLVVTNMIGGLEAELYMIEEELDLVLYLAQCPIDPSDQAFDKYLRHLKRPQVANAIRQALGDRRYAAYVRAFKKCEQSILAIASKMRGLLPDSNVEVRNLAELAATCPPGKCGFHFKNKIMIRLTAGKLESCIDNLTEWRRRMTETREFCSSGGDRGNNPKRGAPARSSRSSFTQIRQCAQSMHFAIAYSWASRCKATHSANLYLFLNKNTLWLSKPVFHVRFSEQLSERNQIAYSQIVDVRVQESNIVCTKPSSWERVQDLCEKLRHFQSSGKNLELSFSNDSHDSELFVRETPEQGTSPLREASICDMEVSLQNVLEHMNTARAIDRSLFWTISQGANLAATLVTSILQLCTTPWLIKAVPKADIMFHYPAQFAAQPTHPIYRFKRRYPFLVRKFNSRTDASVTGPSDVQECGLELGIVVMEIFNRRTFEHWALANKLELTNDFESRYNAAVAWLDQNDTAAEESGKSYGDAYITAVSNCLQGLSMVCVRNKTWENPKVQEMMVNHVLQPLMSYNKST